MAIFSEKLKSLAAFGLVSGIVMAGLPAAEAARETPQVFSADYAVSFLGFTVGKSSFTSRITSTSFELEGSVASAGLGRFFDKTDGTTVATGQFTKNGTMPDAYSVTYTYGKKNKRTALAFKKGTVASVVNTPELPARGPDWVAAQQAHLVAVADPISSTLVKAANVNEVCKRTIRVFDGEIVADIKFSPVKAGKVTVAGYEASGAVCHARFVPVAGYAANNKSLKYLSSRSKITVTFAELGKTGIYAPVHATVGTQVGSVTVVAKRIAAN